MQPTRNSRASTPSAKRNRPGISHHNEADCVWEVNPRASRVMYPAGERLFVSADGKMTLEFKNR